MPDRFIEVKRYKSSVGRNCQHCGRSATVTATRIIVDKRWLVRYCDDHANEIIGKES